MNLKKASCLLVVLAIAPFLVAFQADTPGDSLGIVGGGGQDYYEAADDHMLQYLNYWYLNIPYKHVFNNGNMAVGAVFTFMHLQQQSRTEVIHQTDNVSEFRLVPQWIHNPSRYFGYSVGLFLSITDAHQYYIKDLEPGAFYVMPSVEIRTGAIDLVYFSLGYLSPDLAGDVSGPIAIQIVTGQKLIPYTQLSAGVSGTGGTILVSGANFARKWYGIIPMFSVKITPIKLLSIVASLKMSGEQIWNVSSGVEFHF